MAAPGAIPSNPATTPISAASTIRQDSSALAVCGVKKRSLNDIDEEG